MDTSKLKDRNKNPWYILMTLHGEQEGGEIDWDLAEANRKAWNGWVCQGMDPDALKRAIECTGIESDETQLDEAGLEALTARFGEVWKARNGRDADVPALPDPSDSADLRKTAFSNAVVLGRAIFRSTSFIGATFGGTTYFSNATFGETTHFIGAIFGETTHFVGTTFGETTFFSSATFGETTSYSYATFGEATYFDSATFGENTNFDGATFERFVSFQKAKSVGLVSFKGRVNSRDLEKPAAHFAATTRFSEAHFTGRVNFYQRRFGPYDVETKDLSFANAIFEGPVSFEEAEFPHVLPVLSNTSLPESTKVSADTEKWPKTPAWYNVFDRTYRGWERAQHKSAKASAAVLRHAMSRQSLPEEEHFFFRKEMFHAQRAERWWKVLHIELFDVLSEYGYSIGRPLFWLALVWALGVWVYSTATAFSWSVPTAAGYSFSAMFKFFGFQGTYLMDETRALGSGYEVFAACQTVSGFVLLFFLGLGLRTRFRLR